MKKYFIIIGAAILLGGVYFALGQEHGITIGGLGATTAVEEKKMSSIAGLACDTARRRPVAVMLASDPEARPLSGIGQADLVVEMPVTPNGVTRFMAVYQCQTPKEIGSIRSAREDFIPLAAGFNAIYGHWGGEHGALDRLNRHVTDNVNALTYEGSTFYRKKTVPMPHNGFSTLDLLTARAKGLGYSLVKDFLGYPHEKTLPTKNISNVVTAVAIPYPGASAVDWTYDQNKNLYLRARGGKPEIDKNTASQVTASVVAVMRTTSYILYKGDQYIVVNTTGQGPAEIYQGGIKISGTWKKDSARLDSKLYFYDQNDKEIKFIPGQIWIQITTN